MKVWPLSLLTAALMFASLAPVSGQVQLRPGQYEVTLEMNLAGIPTEAQKAVTDAAEFNKNKRLECITAAELKEGKGIDIARLFAREAEEANCKMSDVKTIGNTLTFTTTCVEDDIRMTMNTEMTFGPDSMTGFTTSKDNEGRTSTVKTRAKRVGDCKQ